MVFLITAEGLKVIEYNCRLGDPEGVLLLENMQTSLYAICEWIINRGYLKNQTNLYIWTFLFM